MALKTSVMIPSRIITLHINFCQNVTFKQTKWMIIAWIGVLGFDALQMYKTITCKSIVLTGRVKSFTHWWTNHIHFTLTNCHNTIQGLYGLEQQSGIIHSINLLITGIKV